MPRTRQELERENARLWEKLEAVYGELRELFLEGDEDENDDEDE